MVAKKKISKKIMILALIAILIWSANFYFLYLPKDPAIAIGDNIQTSTTTTTEATKQRLVSKDCSSSSDCSWKITNCCPENSGGMWECINYKTFEPACPNTILCPQVVLPKPTTACVCEQGKCISK
jgi:hypothetical protein